MKKLSKLAAAGLTSIMTLLATTAQTVAQTYDYSDLTYDAANTLGSGIGVGLIVVYCCALIFGLAYLVFTILMIVDAAKKTDEQLPNKVLWILVMLFVPFGTIAYFFVVKKKLDGQK